MEKPPALRRRRRALLSVTDKSHLEDIAQVLWSFEYELIASGGTASYLRDHGLEVIEVSELTGYPSIFGGRVKTLHPAIHGGILGPDEGSFAQTADLGVVPIDVVCVNLYRFEEAADARGDEAEIVEAIDIGGTALLRAAAKNFRRVTVLSDPDQYEEFLHELRSHDGGTSADFRRRLAAAAFALTAYYDAAITDWFAEDAAPEIGGTRTIELRYGENPHQKGRMTLPALAGESDLAGAGLRLWSGKALSYNNMIDLIAALKLVLDFTEPCCGIIKHTNPCGLGLGEPAAALRGALACDPVSAFGGVFAFNRPVDLAAAELLHERFLEIVVAPEFRAEALALLRRKKNVRLVTCDAERFGNVTRGQGRFFGEIQLSQDEDEGFPELDTWKLAAGPAPDADVLRDLAVTWKVCKHTKSNAIVLGGRGAILGVGAGQMSRVDSVKIAIAKAREQGLDLTGAVAASDAFFPFPDGVQALHAAGVRAIMAPAGSIRDTEVAAAAAALGVSLLLTDRRHFRH